MNRKHTTHRQGRRRAGRLHQILAGITGALLIALLGVLFVFPTKDTESESREVVSRARSSFMSLAYNDAAQAAPAVDLDLEDLELLHVLNPKSGQPFTEAEIKRLKYLRAKFPDNQLLPRIKSPDEAARDEETRAELEQMAIRFNAGRATRADVDGYYDYKLGLLEDWVELLNLVVHEEDWSPPVREKYAAMLQNTEKMRSRIEKQRATMLARNGFSLASSTASR